MYIMEEIITKPLLESQGTPYFKLLMKLNETEEDLRRSKLEWIDLKKEYDKLEEEMGDYGEDGAIMTDLRADLYESEDKFQELLSTLFNDDLRERMRRFYLNDNKKETKKWLKSQKEKHDRHYDDEFSYYGTEDGIIDMVNYYYKQKFGRNTREYDKSMNEPDDDEEEDEEEEDEEEESEEEEDTAEDMIKRLERDNREAEERRKKDEEITVIPAKVFKQKTPAKTASLEVAKEAPKGKLAPAKETKPKTERSEYYSEKTKKNVSKQNVDSLIKNWKKYDGSVSKRKQVIELFAKKLGKKIVLEIIETETDDFNPFEYN